MLQLRSILQSATRDAMFTRLFFVLTYLLAGVVASPVALGQGIDSIEEIAIFPYLSPQKLTQLYLPLAKNLEQELDHPVRVVSAPNYTSFMKRLERQEYLLVINASHMARMAQLDSHYVPILRPITDLDAVVVIPSGSILKDISGLQNGRVAVPSPIAQITQIAGALMRESGLEPGKDVTLVNHPTHSSAVLAVVNGFVDAAVVSSRALDQIGDRVDGKVRVLKDSKQLRAPVPGRAPPVIYQVSPTLGQGAQEELKRIISHFANDTPEGKAFIDRFGYQGLRSLDPGELEAMDPFLPELRLQLGNEGK